MNIKEAVSGGNIRRETLNLKKTVHIPLYQGNGVCGSCYGPFGLHNSPAAEKLYSGETVSKPVAGQTVFMHKNHFLRMKSNLDYLMPVLKIFWDKEPEHVSAYSQEQDFFEATITTSFSDDHGSVKTVSWFDPENVNLAGFKIELTGKPRSILINPCRNFTSHYNQMVELHTAEKTEDHSYRLGYCHNSLPHFFLIKSTGFFSKTRCGARIELKEGSNFLLLSSGGGEIPYPDDSLSSTKSYWSKCWNKTGMVCLPDNRAQSLWIRSLAYILYSFSAHSNGFMTPPCGLSGNLWSFPFPQDLSFILPALLTTGHLDIVQTWIEFYYNQLPGMQEYTRRTFNKEGVHCPWVMPYNEVKDYLVPEPPNYCYYQLHNSGHLARMAHESVLYSGNTEWSGKFAVPLIRECAKFYADSLTRHNDGTWHFNIHPSMGQDEHGGENQKDYLCAFTSAGYCLETALKYNFPENTIYSRILKDGLAFNSLYSPKHRIFCASRSGETSIGRQKHPPQLNSLAFLPLSLSPLPEEIEAYRNRYGITARAEEPFFMGWTLGEFLLSSARMQDKPGWEKDWNNIIKSRLTDSEEIQTYESSSETPGAHFFITSHGLWMQAIRECLLSEWRGELTLSPCFIWKEKADVHRLRSSLGVEITGSILPGSSDIEITAYRNTEFFYNNKKITMKKNEVRKIP